jgi:lipopolysaccharide transport system ATP-binding protein
VRDRLFQQQIAHRGNGMAVVTLANVSKKFALRLNQPRSFQEVFLSALRWRGKMGREEFWALRDVDLEIEQGETIGFIGPNGAGKSTLLKLISRIIEPTTGQVEVRGRVGALLELGAGFHPDLTGRENIFLNGSILGLGRAQIEQSLDEIISFAELERFIDVPVRHYSSGMYVRLGFAVAVHTEPEILLVDEVLAVGDQNFQHKCLERIREMQQQGVTICYVSHDMGTVQRLCSRAVWLDDGGIQAAGDVSDTISCYLEHMAAQEEVHLAHAQPADSDLAGQAHHRWGSGEVRIDSISFLGMDGAPKSVFRTGEPWTVRMHYRTVGRIANPIFGLAVHRNDGVHVCGPNTGFAGLNVPFVDGEGDVLYCVESLPLLEGTYLVSVAVHNQADTVMYDYHDRLYTFRVRQVREGERYGLVTMKGTWEWKGE